MVEISRNTQTQAQFMAQCRDALRKTKNDAYLAWADYISGARDEMNDILNGKREAYHNHHTPDNERPFTETSACDDSGHQVYYRNNNDNTYYNFILEWNDGSGYFYCIDSVGENGITQ